MKAEEEGIVSKWKTVIRLMLFSLILFLFILYSVLTKTFFYDVDVWVSTHSALMHQQTLNKVVIFITHLNGVIGSAILSFVLLVYLASKKYYVEIRFYLISFLGASILFTVIKNIVERTRPQSELIDVVNYSFPSGHSTMAMAMALSFYFIFVTKTTSETNRLFLLLACIFWPILIAFTRVYLNVHWLSDTLAGISLGLFWVLFVKLLLPYPEQK